MAQLLSKERPTIEFELSSSTTSDKKWVKAYSRAELSDIAAFLTEAKAQQDSNGDTSTLIYTIVDRLMIDWSWYQGEDKAPITVETLALIDPVDFLEISDQLGVDGILNRLSQLGMSKSKKKNSSATSRPKRKATKKAQS